jgi:transposase
MLQKAFLGIDVSKGYADFLLLDEHKQAVEEGFQLEDNHGGRQQLGHLIQQWFAKGMEELYCGLESTGGYENNWYSFLRSLSAPMKLQVARLNARAVKAVNDASLKRTITDAVSAHNIASYLISFPEKVDYSKKQATAGEEFKEGRHHYSYVRMLLKQKVQLTNQVEKLLYQYFSEMLVYCRHGIPSWLLRMLSYYACAEAVKKAGETRLAKIKGISIDKARSLIQKANQSDQIISQQLQYLMGATAKEILHKEELINEQKNILIQMYKEQEGVNLISSIGGIGLASAVELMLEIEDVRRFESSKKITAYFGINPTFKQSGDGTWGSHISKKGRSEVRAILYMTALSGIRCNSILKKLYARFRAKGMKHYQAMGVVMHKLLRIIYGILKSKTPFDVRIDEENTSKAEQRLQEEKTRKQKSKEQKKHRYQSLSTDAPLSNRAAKKRMKQIAS